MRRTIKDLKKLGQPGMRTGAVGTCHQASCTHSRVRDVSRVRGFVQPVARRSEAPASF
jgi:hypothetical protein